MPRVRFLTLDAGPDGIRHPGQIALVSDDEAAQLVAGRHAEYIDPPPTPATTAAVQQPETAMRPAGQRRPAGPPRGTP